MKKVLLTFFSLTLVAVLAACGNNNASNNAGSSAATTAPNAEATSEPTKDPVKLVIGASPVPHAEILKAIAPLLEKDGITLEIKEFTDYIQPNVQLDEKELDANFFQHQPYLDDQNKNNKTDLVSVASVHVEPFGAYSKKIKSIDELADGAKVAIPNDATNGGRALILLAKNGLITLKDDTNIAATKADITENKKNLDIIELEAAMLPRQLDEVDLALINTNFALDAGLVPTKDALFIEGVDSPYANILVTRQDNKDSEAIKKLVAALNSPEAKAFIEEKYEGAIIPAF
ncbi:MULTISPECIES: MetQ/NlpA family ABC transporter substrate-binding protein [Paenibacillus]|jgi:D-methionine transport system substrate-binding protein|uniref:Lipoprotein n=1 Tax=Paenibacillus odorifer TaxID=189426 RepID=A0A1R0YW56_9BACL|nr:MULTISPECIES: MetQ/NlpA family ABC transporter substrate-binding protein [Paenibacillus]AIQ76372.1 methionine ABC transporter substrate-binding protein [Paenibacillus odorifer]AWV35662.1 methionine ABC transporter substrate-binding protein [Paenibacillus odorifer]ETT50532.1 Outer membrane lipoprotein 2 [Paenibacillus sp. FSL H8-237]MDH6430961.1 D-methionine transport system substrate-binding protein [Paenibacillus sp. PastH-4]MDH6446839.1 D-methionine transport system substrate-binding prot